MEIEHLESQHRFESVIDGQRSYLYYDVNGKKMNIQSTFVSPALRGQGLARKLVDAAIAYAGSQGWGVEADCWYARKVLDETR